MDHPLQLTYTKRECVRCHRHTLGQRLCSTCLADDERLTRAQAQSLKWAMNAFSRELGYPDALSRTEATCDWYDRKDSEEEAIDHAEELRLRYRGAA